MKYGFVIDHRRCIGCHACTVACKSENEVPLGSYRTWVKYVEQGQYPDTSRSFAVLRCNHCENAPCVTICPVTALFKRDNGIVDFDGRRCIGCKACMQACPYDALYINPFTNTAEKCNFCAHRVELGLQPACVVVCPEQAIIAGDLDNPLSKISSLIASENTQVRKPEAQTLPKLYYIETSSAALKPVEQTHSGGYIWAEQKPDPIRDDQEAMFQAETKARTTYDVAHDRPWGWKVSAYLFTKSVSAGAFIVAALALTLSQTMNRWLFDVAAPIVALAFLAVTTALLVLDLKRPERFLSILFRPQWKSWLVLGGYTLLAFGGVVSIWLGAYVLEIDLIRPPLMWLGVILAALTAGYSAFLFRQARGRVFWNSPLVLPHLLVQSLIAGAAGLLIVAMGRSLLIGAPMEPASLNFLTYELLGSLIAHGVFISGELFSSDESIERHRTIRLITHGIFRKMFLRGAILIGLAAPIAAVAGALFLPEPLASYLVLTASFLSLLGVFCWEHTWVQAGQAVPLS
ncbi:MAG: 4Fe-4S ferredoxin [Blastocatellia bacterium AA13]|nr:MAG: 4Fe-4S ferredoxin [Blastocatellia bacterium AA13]